MQRSWFSSSVPKFGLPAFVLMGAALSAGACGEATSTEPAALEAAAVVSSHVSNGEGEVYMARLQPLNPEQSYRPVHGAAILKVKDGILTVRVNASGLQPGMVHPQHIHVNASCPPANADGGDGIINLVDGLPYYGPVLTGLDADLVDLSMGPGFPNPQNAGGAIAYEVTASVSDLMTAVGGPLDLRSRVVVLHGVSATTDLSADPVAAANPVVLPIACGTID
jgi:hypothetical protein